jgi:spermidine synthase
MINKHLSFTVFVSGMTTLAIELSASRLLGSVFGTSNLVWASIIGLILIYLTLGYFLGGHVSDRYPTEKHFYTIIAWGAFFSGIVPFISKPVLRLAADAFDSLQIGVLLGSFTAVMVLLIIPVTLLGMVSPYAIRLSIKDSRIAGKVSGRIYAISTLGSFLGTFLPVLVTIPLIGTTLTFLTFGSILLITAFIGLGKSTGWKSAVRYLWLFLVLIILGILWGNGVIKKSEGQVYEKESSYNYIQVLEIDGYTYLRLNEGQGIHSIYHPNQIAFNGAWMQVLAAPFFNKYPFNVEDVESVAIIGLAGGTIARQATEVFGPIPISGFEIDPEIIRVGEEYFGMTMSNLTPLAEDGRWGLEHSNQLFSMICIDAYRPPYIPWHLTTKEFFQIVFDHLTNDGVVTVNVGRSPGDRRLIDDLTLTMNSIFPSVYIMDVPDTFNSIIYATIQPTSLTNIYQNYLELSESGKLSSILDSAITRTINNIQPLPRTGVVFTDDLAPVEWITNRMVLSYVLTSDFKDLQ